MHFPLGRQDYWFQSKWQTRAEFLGQLNTITQREGGAFCEVYVATPLAECERRDPKGLYHSARHGLLTNFTGIDDPYEAPENHDVELAEWADLNGMVGHILERLADGRLVGTDVLAEDRQA